MLKKIDSKTPIENWRVELVEDSRDVAALIAGAERFNLLRSFENMLAKSRAYAECYLEEQQFVLLADGELATGRIPNKQLHVLQIDLTEHTHPALLARLELEISLRRQRKQFNDWFVHGHLKDSDIYVDYLELNHEGGFYLRNRRQLWNVDKKLLASPLP
jgi:hypothetical protein